MNQKVNDKWMVARVVAACLMMSVAQSTWARTHVVTGKSAVLFLDDLKKAFKKKGKEVVFKEIRCAYEGPDGGHACHRCWVGKDAAGKELPPKDNLGKPCKTCDAFAPKHPEFCELDQERVHAPKATLTRIGKFMCENPHTEDMAMGGWYSCTFGAGKCAKSGPRGHAQMKCEYYYRKN